MYGGSLYDLAAEEGLDERILGELDGVTALLNGDAEYLHLLSIPSIPKKERCALLDEAFRGQVHLYVLNFLKILCEKGTLRELGGCTRAYRIRYNEAIPLSSESLVLLITKVEYPEELDTRFSQFTEAGDEELFSNMGAAGNVERKGADDILELFQKIREAKASPESENAQQTEAPEEVPEVPADLTKMFEFTTIDQVERLAHVLVNYYNGRNDLFKNEKKNRFYLVIHKDDHTPEEFNKVCNIICEYAQQKNYNPAVGAYFAEHGNKITGPQALQVFASL
jgi:adapter protein MecA 1/2